MDADPKAVAALAEALRAMARDTGWTLVLSQGTSWEAVAAVVAARLPHGWRLEQAAEGCGITGCNIPTRIGYASGHSHSDAARPSPEPSASGRDHFCPECGNGHLRLDPPDPAFRPSPEPSASGLIPDWDAIHWLLDDAVRRGVITESRAAEILRVRIRTWREIVATMPAEYARLAATEAPAEKEDSGH